MNKRRENTLKSALNLYWIFCYPTTNVLFCTHKKGTDFLCRDSNWKNKMINRPTLCTFEPITGKLETNISLGLD